MTTENLKNKRIAALDITRGVAVLGMIYMNFRIVLSGTEYQPEYSFMTSQEGRFGVLFIFLAGIGVSLMSRRAYESEDPIRLRKNRIVLAKRALFLLITGMVFSLYWFADILHFYSVYLILALPLLKLSRKALMAISPVPVFIALTLHLSLNWETGWDFQEMVYIGFYQPAGFIRNLFFNGFHPVFPWFTFFILGMAAGRKIPEPCKGTLIKVIMSGAVFFLCELISFCSQNFLNEEVYGMLFSTRAFPPTPLFVLSSAAQSLFLFYLIVLLSSSVKKGNVLAEALSRTGRMVMTHYVVHLILGLIPLLIASAYLDLSALFVFLYSLCYFLFTMALTLMWNRRFQQGPLEGLMRRFS